MNFIAKTVWALSLLLPLAACAKQEAPAKTMTNEQGCTRIRSIGPQDPYKDPPPLKQACLGPYLLEIPQNYFYNQIGAEHDGSYALALEYPSLEAFKPGERMRLSVDVAARTVMVRYDYIDRTDVEEVMRVTHSPTDSRKDRPQETLDSRVQGKPENGLTPYYADMEKVRAYYVGMGFPHNSGVMAAEKHADWFIAKDQEGSVTTVIKCTPRAVAASGVEYRNGKMVKAKGPGFAECDHTMMMPEIDTLVRMNYPREGLQQWQRIEKRSREMANDYRIGSAREVK